MVLVLLALLDTQDIPVLLDCLVHPVITELQVLLVRQGLMERLVAQEVLGILERQVLWDRQDHMVLTEALAVLVSPVPLVHQDLPGHQDFLDSLVFKVDLDILDRQVQLVSVVLQERLEELEFKVELERLVSRVLQALLAIQAFLGQRVARE